MLWPAYFRDIDFSVNLLNFLLRKFSQVKLLANERITAKMKKEKVSSPSEHQHLPHSACSFC